MKLKTKLSLAIAIVSVVLLFFAGDLVVIKLKTYFNLYRSNKLVELAVKIGDLVHEIQKERGTSAGFLGAKGTKFREILSNQRILTDQRLRDLKQALSHTDINSNPRFKKYIIPAMNQLQYINQIRQKVDNLAIPVKQEVAYYTKINSDLLNAVGAIGFDTSNSYISKELNAYTNFLLSKEMAGIERAVLSNTFALNHFGPGMYEKFITLVAEQKSYLHSFRISANKKFLNYFKEHFRGQCIQKVNRMR